MTIERVSDTLTRISLVDREIILIGTAHISHESVQEVTQTIRENQPDHVCLEIDAGRYKVMREGQSWKDLNIGNILKQGKGFFLLANLALSSFQRRMGATSGITPGEEIRAAADAADEAGISYSFCDRDIQTTLRRAWKRSNLWNKLKLFSALLASAFSNEKLTDEDIESLKERNALEAMMDELAQELPLVKEVLIDERDRYLATKIFTSPGKRIVAIIGAGHAKGIITTLQDLEAGSIGTRLDDIDTIPPNSRISKVIPWSIPVIVIGMMAYGFIHAGWSQGVRMFTYWFLVNGILSGIGAIISLAHPITIVLSFLLAPFTSLNPTIGVGIIVGGFEAYIRKPRVVDFESLPQDILSLRGFYKNRVTHALLVFFLTSLGSSIGTFIAFPFIASLLA